jgi:predicted DNA-binding protein
MSTTQYNVKNIPPEVLTRAKELAKQLDRPLNQVVRELLREWIAKNEKKYPPKK